MDEPKRYDSIKHIVAILGFVIGILRLSRNWLIGKLAAVYVETLRNIPLLVQCFFWYFGLITPLPGPRQSLSIADAFFVNARGIYTPGLVPEPMDPGRIAAEADLRIVRSFAVDLGGKRGSLALFVRNRRGRSDS